jgi:hypothetical protein
MSVEKNNVDTVEDVSIRSPNEGQALSFEGMGEKEMKEFEKKRKKIHYIYITATNIHCSRLED